MSKFARNLSILIVLVLFGVALAACGSTEAPVTPEEPVVEEPVETVTEEVPVEEPVVEETTEATDETPADPDAKEN